MSDEGGALRLDDTAKRIIEHLQEDGRRSYSEIGRQIGLSEAAVRQRVQRLVEGGVIQITAVTDPLQLGFARQAMIGIHAEGDLEAVAAGLAGIDEVDYVLLTTGRFDLLVETVTADDEEFFTLLNQRIRKVPGVRATETFMYLKLVKQSYKWGTR
ncbi:Lrp/AsnC family transcriptional regulator [Pseudoclavibacter sp. 13-3]|uniref:Lrp/AsnC family transcriptional regulator n=1 Tax=Pseudoclavibacter sp. 13-3 TaxID=2901228 RepID=UPI001E5549CE|nr:Lrp/AsnC family transcriptional regulator [Pseudoclavibacter sp. 13-3]MCD7101344.1 Lrp/AsnC family transcriptional regulator [Pseudoclavibacter sp. 13-3]